jgi:hypothetical protein
VLVFQQQHGVGYVLALIAVWNEIREAKQTNSAMQHSRVKCVVNLSAECWWQQGYIGAVKLGPHCTESDVLIQSAFPFVFDILNILITSS